MYLRFVASDEDPITDVYSGEGIIVVAESLKTKVDDWVFDRICEIFFVLNCKLPVPPYSSNNWPIDAISWFKDSATEFIGLTRELANLLKSQDYQVKMFATDNPGKILYEDEYQIVAEVQRWTKKKNRNA